MTTAARVMQKQTDWRHLLLAVVAVAAILVVGWRVFLGPPAPPNVPAPAGANPRMEDVRDFPEPAPRTQVPTPRSGVPE